MILWFDVGEKFFTTVFIKKKKEAMDKTSESRDKLREKKLQELGVAKEKISTQQE